MPCRICPLILPLMMTNGIAASSFSLSASSPLSSASVSTIILWADCCRQVSSKFDIFRKRLKIGVFAYTVKYAVSYQDSAHNSFVCRKVWNNPLKIALWSVFFILGLFNDDGSRKQSLIWFEYWARYNCPWIIGYPEWDGSHQRSQYPAHSKSPMIF